MKSIEELKRIREETLQRINLRKEDGEDNVRIVVGMATCGIAAGARPVLQACVEEVQKRGLSQVSVTQTGCIGVCRLEPIIEVYVPGEEKVTYVKMTADKARTVIAEHIVNHRIAAQFTIGEADKQ